MTNTFFMYFFKGHFSGIRNSQNVAFKSDNNSYLLENSLKFHKSRAQSKNIKVYKNFWSINLMKINPC